MTVVKIMDGGFRPRLQLSLPVYKAGRARLDVASVADGENASTSQSHH